MEKVGSTEEKLPLKPDTPSAELRRMFSPDEIRQKFTPDEIRQKFTPDEIYKMFTPVELFQMFTPYILREMFTDNQMSTMRVPKPRKPRLTEAQTEAMYSIGRDVKYSGALEKGKKIIC